MHRKGLTLVEMLVALALTIFLMAILSEAFVTGLQAFRRLKAVGDMDQQLRTVANILRRDLQAPHFEGTRRLSTYDLNLQTDGKYDRPNLGYFCIREGHAGGITSLSEGIDGVSRPSVRDTNVPSDALAFTVRLPGDRPENIFYGAVPLSIRSTPGFPAPLDVSRTPPQRFDEPERRSNNLLYYGNRLYSSQWAEVIYFIEPDGNRTAYDDTTNTFLPLFKLYRVQLLLVPNLDGVEPYAAWDDVKDDGTVVTTVIEDAVPWANYYAGNVGPRNEYKHDVSAYAEPQTNGRVRYRFNTPADVQFPARRFGGTALNYRRLGAWSNNPLNNRAREGTDLLCVNVLSWDIKVFDPIALTAGPTGPFRPEFVDLGQNQPGIRPPPGWSWNGPTSPAPSAQRSNFLMPKVLDLDNDGIPDAQGYVFDTLGNREDPNLGNLGATTAPYPGPLRAIQIRLRIWDERTRQTREITIVQDL